MSRRLVKPLTQVAEQYLDNVEAKWAGSLHLSMLGTPLRSCVVTSKVVPTALLMQYKSVELHPDSTGGSSKFVILPDRILHPKYVMRKKGKGAWMTLNPTILEIFYQRKQYKMLNTRANLSPNFGTLVHTQLSQRVIQELDILCTLPPADRETLVRSFTTQKDAEIYISSQQQSSSFVLDLNQTMSAETDPCNSSSGLPLIFQPKLCNEAQKFELAQKLSTLLGSGSVHVFSYSATTVPLGISLYRLQLWMGSVMQA